MTSPTGRTFEIGYGDARAVVEERGATLRSYDVGDRRLLDPMAGEPPPPRSSRGEVLLPWPNRVVDGRWSWRGTDYQLALTEPERGHALHGLVRDLAWTLVDSEPARVVLEVLLLARPGWPFPLRSRAAYDVSAAGLTVSVTTSNVGAEPVPYGVAAHPYLALPGGRVDDATLDLPAGSYVETDERLAPVARHPTAGTAAAFTAAEPIGTRRADTAFTDLPRRPDGAAVATLRAADGVTTLLWGDESVRWWQVFTGDGLPVPWRRQSVAVEPMSCGPDALNTGEDLVVLDPGGSHTMRWGLTLF